MTAVPVPVRFNEEQIEAIDRMVEEGVGETRSEVIRRAVERLEDTIRRARIGEEIAESYRQQPQTEDEVGAGLAVVKALIEEEPWVWTEDGQLLPEWMVIEQGIPRGEGPPRPRPDWGEHWQEQ